MRHARSPMLLALALLAFAAAPLGCTEDTPTPAPAASLPEPTLPGPTGAEESSMIEDGRTVALEYTLKLDDGSTADTNVGGEPLVYQQGAKQMLPAFEQAISGMQVEETRAFSLTPGEGYGVVNPELRQPVELDMIPAEARHAGAQLMSEDGAGNRQIVTVFEVQEEAIVLDLNHPLAGENLHFEVKVIGVQ